MSDRYNSTYFHRRFIDTPDEYWASGPRIFPGLLSNEFNVLSWNIDTNIGMVETGNNAGAFPEYSFSRRWPHIRRYLMDKIVLLQPALIHIQEGRRCTLPDGVELDSVTPVVRLLRAMGYHVHTQSYLDGDKMSFVYITAFKSDIFTLLKTDRWYMTRTPEKPTDRTLSREEILHNNYGELFERCVFHCALIHTASRRMVHSINTHLGIGGEYRVAACDLLRSKMEQLSDSVICTGDFNTFPDWKGPEQLLALSRPLSDGTRLTVNSAADWTFIPSPYDMIGNEYKPLLSTPSSTPEERRQVLLDVHAGLNPEYPPPPVVGGALDLVVTRGFASTTIGMILTPTDLRTFSTLAEAANSDVPSMLRSYTLDCAKSTSDAAFASDHQMVVGNVAML